MSDAKEVKIIPGRDMLIEQRNNFQKQLVDDILDYQRHLEMKESDPNYQRQNPQNGKYTGIEDLIEKYREAIVNARAYVNMIDDLLKIDAEGNLNDSLQSIGKVGDETNKEESKE